MALKARSTATATAPAVPAGRDPVIDLVRAACLVVVVGLHALMAGISTDGDRLVVGDATHGQGWFAVLTWLVQIMPLFFLAGGFANLTQWRRLRSRGGTAAAYVHGRLIRLARPAVITFGTIAAGFALASLLGAPDDLLGQVGYRMGQPMWFLAVYLGVSAVAPIMVRLHEKAPGETLVVLAVAAVLVDGLRAAGGAEGVGYANLGFVWLALQQLGFGYADGWFRRIDRRLLPAAIVAGLLLLIMIVGTGRYPVSMIDNLNPPTCCLLLLGLVQVLALTLAEPALRRWTRLPDVRRTVAAINGHAMTIYLWHMAVLVAVALIVLAVGLPFPEPLGPVWWLTRGCWLLAVGTGMVLTARAIGGYERGAGHHAAPTGGSLRRAVAAVVIAVAAVITVLVAGFSVLAATAAALGLAAALRLADPAPPRRPLGSGRGRVPGLRPAVPV